jgi:hypothetical protein
VEKIVAFSWEGNLVFFLMGLLVIKILFRGILHFLHSKIMILLLKSINFRTDEHKFLYLLTYFITIKYFYILMAEKPRAVY